MADCAIEFKNVSKIYKLSRKDEKRSGSKLFYALKDISFKIGAGEVAGVLGTNGSGKSTMALLLAEISAPNEGSITVNGEQALVAVNTGLNGQLTGCENIKLKGALLGLKPHEISEIIEGVEEFSELGEFLYQPVKKYSSGMKSRLGFSINLCLDPDIMIIDEALSVGDKSFAGKCIERMRQLKNEGKTIVFISHNLAQVESFCDTAVWIEGGMMKEYGPVGEVAKHYSDYVEYLNALSKAERAREMDEKFQRRVISSKKESLMDRALSSLPGR